MAQIKDEAELVKAGLLIDDLTGERALNQPRLITAIQEHFEGSSLENGRIVTKDGKYDIIVKNNLDIVVVKHGEEYISEGEIGITYTTQDVDEGVEVTLYFEMSGIEPLKEYPEWATEVLNNLPTTEPERTEALEQMFIEGAKYFGETLEEGLDCSDFEEYMLNDYGDYGFEEGEEPTTLEGFRLWINEHWEPPTFNTVEEMLIYWDYVEPEQYEEYIQHNGVITVEVSNGDSFEVSIQDMQATYTITQNGTYTFTAIGPNGEIGEITIEINNIVIAYEFALGKYVNYTDKNGNKIVCQVLYDANSEYGLQLVAVNPVDTVTLGFYDPTIPAEMASESNFEKAKYSYNNAITTLNNKAEEYRNPLYTDEGGARCIGSMPNNPNSESGYFTGSYEYLTTYGWNGVFKDEDANYNTDWNQLDLIGARGITDTSKSSYYWLASRDVDSRSWYTNFYVRSAGSSGDLNYRYLCDLDSGGTVDSNGNSYGFRPVFSLKPTVKIKEGVGTGKTPETAFELEVQ